MNGNGTSATNENVAALNVRATRVIAIYVATQRDTGGWQRRTIASA